MIYYALSAKEGARELARKYGLREVSVNKYIKESALFGPTVVYDHDRLMYVLQDHLTVFAFTLSGLKLYFHPDTVLPIVADAYKEHFKNLMYGEFV